MKLSICGYRILFQSRRGLTLFGIMTSCWALLMDPDSSFPRITVPISYKQGNPQLEAIFK